MVTKPTCKCSRAGAESRAGSWLLSAGPAPKVMKERSFEGTHRRPRHVPATVLVAVCRTQQGNTPTGPQGNLAPSHLAGTFGPPLDSEGCLDPPDPGLLPSSWLLLAFLAVKVNLQEFSENWWGHGEGPRRRHKMKVLVASGRWEGLCLNACSPCSGLGGPSVGPESLTGSGVSGGTHQRLFASSGIPGLGLALTDR